jgi:TM2 domain-containing membrane protein YozV
MTADRLQRCNPSAWQYLGTYYFGLRDTRIFDPPENHYLLAAPKPDLSAMNGHKLRVEIEAEKSRSAIPCPWLFEPVNVQNFADYLFNSHDFERACAEYKRLYFLSTDKRIKKYAQLMMGESYLANKEFKNALLTFSNLDDSGFIDLKRYNQARIYLELGEYQTARQTLFLIKDTNLLRLTQILIGWSYFREKNFASGAMTFNSLTDDSLLNNLIYFTGQNLSKRSRLISTTLSTILPGLGQIYSGRLGDGLYSLLTIATTTTITLYYWQNDQSKVKFSIFAFLTGLFWLGNIYGANIAARDFNEYQQNNYLAKIEEILNRIDLKPNYQFLLTQ